MMFEIVYVNGHYFDKTSKQEVEKTKTHAISAETEEEARSIFTEQINKKIVSVSQSSSNTLGNMFPELQKLKDKLK